MNFAEQFEKSRLQRSTVSQTAMKANIALAYQEAKFREDEENICPGCSGRQWIVGRITAECANANCGLPLQIATNTSVAIPTIVRIPGHIEEAAHGRFVVNGKVA